MKFSEMRSEQSLSPTPKGRTLTSGGALNKRGQAESDRGGQAESDRAPGT